MFLYGFQYRVSLGPGVGRYIKLQFAKQEGKTREGRGWEGGSGIREKVRGVRIGWFPCLLSPGLPRECDMLSSINYHLTPPVPAS